MLSINMIIKGLISSIESFQDLKRKEMSKSYFPTSMQVIGITGPNEKIIVKELIAVTRSLSSRIKIELAIKLVDCNIFECQHIAYILLHEDKKVFSFLTLEDLDRMDKNLDNWASVDTFSVYIYGVAWRIGIISDEKVKELISSKDHWQRRIAVVSTVSLNLKSQGGTGDTNIGNM
jgi:3-methyladenine DNA glycosylase AlkD